jgi:hypothetical protein
MLLAAAGIGWALAACGNVTVGGFTRVTVDVSGDAADPLPQPAVLAAVSGFASTSPAASAERPLPAPDEAEEPEGEVEIDVRLVLVADDGSSVALGRDDIRIKLDLQGVDEAEAVNDLVPAARYTELRISFTHIQVEVEGGLVVDGQPITGELHVELEDPELLVSRPLDIEAVEGTRVELLVDLNAPDWVRAVDPATRTIDAMVFAGLIDVVAR